MSSPVDIVDLASADLRLREDAARVLLEAFEARGNSEWPGSIDAARAEVAECCAGDSICIGLASTAAEPGEAAASALMGWAGLRPL